MAGNIINFTRQREIHELKRKEDKVDALRKAFRQARSDAADLPNEKTNKNRKRRNKRPRK
jgi:hypothetical protein